MKKVVSVSLSPNVQKKDIFYAASLLLRPYKWIRGKHISKFEKKFSDIVGASNSISFDSGRSALLIALKALGVSDGDEVIVPGYTCSVVPNAIIYTGAKPVYIDIDEQTYNIDAYRIESAITKKTKVIIAQHTFGLPCDIEKIVDLAKEHNIKVIEDCAHALGSESIGSFGDIAIWSFGRDKVISCVHGGMATTNDDNIANKIREFKNGLSYPSRKKVFQQLFHPVAFSIVLPLYRLFLGKVLLVLFQKLGLLSRVMERCEKKSVRPKYHPLRLANSLAVLAQFQLKRLDEFTEHRRQLASQYEKLLDKKGVTLPRISNDATCLMYTILSDKAVNLRKKLKKNGFITGSWHGKPLVPHDIDLARAQYKSTMCPVAEKISSSAVNLPTNINTSHEDVERICDLI
jgi:dTDP-4-amino-4,6-dideoxygalactose transaminase